MDLINARLRQSFARQYTIDEIAEVADALREAKPDGRTIAAFIEAKVNFRTSPVRSKIAVSEHVWCYGTVELRKGKNDIYTIIGTVEGRDAFSYAARACARGLPQGSARGRERISRRYHHHAIPT